MALFGFAQKETIEDVVEINFDNVVVECVENDVAKELEKVARDYSVNIKKLDFKILSYKTYYKNVNSPRYRELKELDREDFYREENLLNQNLEIIQKVKVEIFKKRGAAFPLKFSLGGNKALTKIIITVKKQDKVQYSNELESRLIAEFDKRKLKLKMLLGFCDKQVRSEIKKLVSSIRVNQKIEKDYPIVLCQSFDVQKHIMGEIIHKYKEKEVDESNRVDHSNKGYMHTVGEGMVIIEVIKPKEGKAGRNCRGKIIPLKEVELSDETTLIKVSDDIEEEELDGMIIYKAKRSGFINEVKPNTFEISDELIVDEVSFKSVGSIEGGYDKDIKIDIKGNDSMTDAVGAGVHIETSEIKVDGNIGNSAVVKANNIQIGGHIHQSAKIYGGDVTVNLNKGLIEGEKVTVELLEGGTIIGDIVRVKKASGGEIIAKEVYIETVFSNVTVKASHHIELDAIEGAGNKFTIDAKAQRGFDTKVDSIDKNIKENSHLEEGLSSKLKNLKTKILSEKENTEEITKRLKDFKASGTKPPFAMLSKIKESQARIKEHNLLIRELKDVKIANETLAEDLKNLQSSVFEAKVINKSVWKDFNEVIFNIIEPPVSASLLFKDGDMDREITLNASMENEEFTLNRKR